METKNSPFSSNIFQNIWKKHFISNKPIKAFKFVEGVSFYMSHFSLFINVGKNLTKGNTYKVNKYEDYRKNTFLIYDVLPHLTKESNDLPENIGVLKSKQYPGYLIHLNKFNDIEDYLLKTFSKNTRMKMRKFNKRLVECFDISTKMFYGDIDKTEYDELFKNFMFLLQKRYSEKQISYNNMKLSEWNFYKEVAYPLILEKKASLFVVYDKKSPIAITYNYHTEDSLIDAITVFDIDYSKFNIGYINNLKILKWCFNNNLKILDFSKGYFEYKKRMCTLEYDFEYHIIFDKRSVKSRLIAHSYYNFLEFKTYLRNKKIDAHFHKFTYRLKKKKESPINDEIEIIKLDKLPESKYLIKINFEKDLNYSFLKKHINEFLYLVIKPYNKIELFKVNSEKKTFILSSDSIIRQIKFVK